MIEIKLQNDKKNQNLFKQLIKKTSNFTPLMKVMSETLLYAVQENFETEGERLSGGGWQEHSKVTEEKYKKEGKWPAVLLQQSGLLLGDITPDYDNNSAQVGTNKEYATIHNFGGQAGWGRKVTIPQREFMTVNREDEEDLVNDVFDYLNSK